MANNLIKVKDELKIYKCDFGLAEKIPCSDEQNQTFMQILASGGQLPPNVHRYKNPDTGELYNEFYFFNECDLTESELQEFLTYKKLKLINTIKNCAVFFTVLTIISLVITFIFGTQIAKFFN